VKLARAAHELQSTKERLAAAPRPNARGRRHETCHAEPLRCPSCASLRAHRVAAPAPQRHPAACRCRPSPTAARTQEQRLWHAAVQRAATSCARCSRPAKDVSKPSARAWEEHPQRQAAKARLRMTSFLAVASLALLPSRLNGCGRRHATFGARCTAHERRWRGPRGQAMQHRPLQSGNSKARRGHRVELRTPWPCRSRI
jgi:hypothetical protein